MPLWKIAWRSIQRRALASGLTALSMGLGVMLAILARPQAVDCFFFFFFLLVDYVLLHTIPSNIPVRINNWNCLGRLIVVRVPAYRLRIDLPRF